MLQRAVLMHMSKTDINSKEKENLKMIFDALDDEKDGELELEEFVVQLNEKFDIKVQVKEMEQIMKQIDLDYDGKVQFSEFIIAACNKRSLFTEDNVKKCFMHIDADADGEISLEDLQEFLGKEMATNTVVAIFHDADVNGDGGLSFEEFQMMMLKVLKTSERNR